jgi:hypothetical protein
MSRSLLVVALAMAGCVAHRGYVQDEEYQGEEPAYGMFGAKGGGKMSPSAPAAKPMPAPSSQVAQAVVQPPPPPPKREPVIVAVFRVQRTGANADDPVLDQLTEYLSARLTEVCGFRVVPPELLRQRLVEEKTQGYRQCFDQSCQIEIGKAVAAQKSLSTRIVQVGDQCALTATLYDLKTETTERSATARMACSDNALMDGMDQIAKGLVDASARETGSAAAGTTPAPELDCGALCDRIGGMIGDAASSSKMRYMCLEMCESAGPSFKACAARARGIEDLKYCYEAYRKAP